ncbi:acyl-CoA thioesterase [Kribbella sp. NPDC051137]|uniref:acyl-CoA thioesterase n=1 Tax=Kribbella sp. NPDC051137 TaxID=3155045 RepID=UPI0034206C79
MTRMVQFAWRTLVRTRPVPGRRLLDPVVTRMRVLPQDLDAMMVVNNGSHLQLIDVAAAQQIAEMGGTRLAAKRSWVGFVAASTMRYRRPLKLWDRIEITSRVIGWDERLFYTEHVITRGGELCTRGVVGRRFVSTRTGDRIVPGDIASLLAQERGYVPQERPELPADVAAWIASWNGAPTDAVPTGPTPTDPTPTARTAQ